MDVCVGDRVQIVNGGMDVTNGLRAKSGKMYGAGGPLWATVVFIDPNWKTGGKFGLPSTVTKVRCAANGSDVIVWQVRPEDCTNIIKTSKKEEVQKEPTPKPPQPPPPTDAGKEELTPKKPDPTPTTSYVNQMGTVSLVAYAPKEGTDYWDTGLPTSSTSTGDLPETTKLSTKFLAKSPLVEIDGAQVPLAGKPGWRELTAEEKADVGSGSVDIDDNILVTQFPVSWENSRKRQLMLDDIYSEVQNDRGFPYTSGEEKYTPKVSTSKIKARRYDFQIIPGDPRYSSMVSLEDKLRDVRAAFGIPVHGDNNFARAMKYYMYNRFKVPDTNLLHNKSVTYVFFSRPDLNLLHNKEANQQTLNHTEAAMVWRRYPEIFKLLTDCKRCGDTNNFNMLLSNQVTSFEIRDEELSTIEAGKSWGEYSMPYGDSYSGRTAGEFSCNFTETSDYSVINLIKLWITYIDNVGRGAWSPSYNLSMTDGTSLGGVNSSHVFTKTLDYAASAYVFKCGPDGEDVLYWSKYYGVFPISTGAGALSWDNDSSIGTGPKLNIRFRYAWKRDMSPISLLEFNNLARISSNPVAENNFNPKYGHSSRPFVGVPFIEMFLANPQLRDGGAALGGKRTAIRLKFKNTEDLALSDDSLYRATFVGRKGYMGKADVPRFDPDEQIQSFQSNPMVQLGRLLQQGLVSQEAMNLFDSFTGTSGKVNAPIRI